MFWQSYICKACGNLSPISLALYVLVFVLVEEVGDIPRLNHLGLESSTVFAVYLGPGMLALEL